MNILIRYSKVNYSDNLYMDYYKSGIGEDTLKLSEDGKEDIKHFSPDINIKRIFYSPSSSCKETALEFQKKFGKVEIVELQELSNVKHDFSKLTDKNLWANGTPDNKEMQKLRTKFIESFLEDKLLERRNEIEKWLLKLREILDSEKDGLFITHGIVLKLFELLFKNTIQNKENLIANAELEKPFYGALKGYFYPGFQKI
jgi:broad specificity phosphatase PhoE